MFLSCHVRVSEWIHTLYLPEYQGTPCSKQGPYMKFKWLQRDSNPQPLASLAKWLSVGLRTKCLWVRVQLQALKTSQRIVHKHIFTWPIQINAIFPEVFLFDVRVINKMKLMRCTFILKNFINRTDESSTVSSVIRYTRNKYIFHTKPNTFFSNIYNIFGAKIFIGFCIKNVIYPHVQNSNICFDLYFV